MAKTTSTTRITTSRITKRVLIPKTSMSQRADQRLLYPHRRAPHDKGDLLPEYNPLADLYDLEYDHDYDLPFWLALAEREGGSVVEWGAGTGRLSVPLAVAGVDVTAVEVSENMLEKGREKGDAVDWVRGDM